MFCMFFQRSLQAARMKSHIQVSNEDLLQSCYTFPRQRHKTMLCDDRGLSRS